MVKKNKSYRRDDQGRFFAFFSIYVWNESSKNNNTLVLALEQPNTVQLLIHLAYTVCRFYCR
jgi:hypothetical protein